MGRHSRRRFLRDSATVASVAAISPRMLAESMSPGSQKGRGAEAMEAALERLARTGPEYRGRLANHGPMAAEALVVMDRPDAVVPWVDFYRRRLYEHPAGSRAIDPRSWREALGVDDRVGDWIVFFDRQVDEKPWKDVLVEWVPRLSPGIIAAAFHGVIRTAHAVRSLDAEETPARRRELAEGLAYWAATYNELPQSTPRVPGRRKPSEAIRDVQPVPADKRQSYGNITDRLHPLDAFPPFAGVADLVDSTGDSSAFVSNLTETFAHAYLVNVPNGGSVITYLHGVTGPSAMRLLIPHLDAAACAEMLRYGWQGAAGVYAASGGIAGVESAAALPAPGSFDDLIDRAIATRDEHAIKFTEACRRENAFNPKPVYYAAAKDAVSRLG